MKSKLTKLAICLLVGILGISVLSSTSAFAADACSVLESGSAAWEAAGCGGSGNKLPGLVVGILNAVIGISSLVAVVFIIVGGINYMTSAGDTGKTQKAKNTILYALIGLVVCVLSFAIVNWAIGAIGGSGTPTTEEAPADSETDSDSEPRALPADR
ncbi:hypothetical protein J6V85_01125 [Candidatus Saccharibacteria bacterium]|nr:hypothetical protein [Candidatus Saccharibacteria bacterium]